jgi:hypothetical protein
MLNVYCSAPVAWGRDQAQKPRRRQVHLNLCNTVNDIGKIAMAELNRENEPSR